MKLELCRHIRTNGDRCKSASLRGYTFCYFHKRLHDQHTKAITQTSEECKQPIFDNEGAIIGLRTPAHAALDLGPLEDRAAVQMAISTVLNALACGRLDRSRATALLYGLQLASTNCIRKNLDHAYCADPVTHVEVTPSGDIIAA